MIRARPLPRSRSHRAQARWREAAAARRAPWASAAPPARTMRPVPTARPLRRSLHVQHHAQRSVFHQPQAGREKSRVGLRPLREVRNRNILRAGAGQPRDCGRNLAYVIGVGANLDLGDARNHLRHAHRDKEMIRAGVAFVEHVRTADGAAAGSASATNIANVVTNASADFMIASALDLAHPVSERHSDRAEDDRGHQGHHHAAVESRLRLAIGAK